MEQLNLVPNPEADNSCYFQWQHDFRMKSLGLNLSESADWTQHVFSGMHILPQYIPQGYWPGVAKTDRYHSHIPDSFRLPKHINLERFTEVSTAQVRTLVDTLADANLLYIVLSDPETINLEKFLGKLFNLAQRSPHRRLDSYFGEVMVEGQEFTGFSLVNVPELYDYTKPVNPDYLTMKYLYETVGSGNNQVAWQYQYRQGVPGNRLGMRSFMPKGDHFSLTEKVCPASAFEVYAGLSGIANFLATYGVIFGKLLSGKPDEFFLPRYIFR